MLEIKNLHAEIEGKPILMGVNLTICPGEIHAIMGPNGAGKSTLAKVLAGHPSYVVTEGEVTFHGQNLLMLSPEERSQLGLFLSFQYPPEITGVGLFQFLYEAFRGRQKNSSFSETDFSSYLDEKMSLLQMNPDFKKRDLNEGFSGGEKKRSEILQMAVLQPTLSILDETDSGLDIDAMRIVAEGVKKVLTPEKSLLIITHYQRLLDYLSPDVIHIFINGKIVSHGKKELALQLEESGYSGLNFR